MPCHGLTSLKTIESHLSWDIEGKSKVWCSHEWYLSSLSQSKLEKIVSLWVFLHHGYHFRAELKLWRHHNTLLLFKIGFISLPLGWEHIGWVSIKQRPRCQMVFLVVSILVLIVYVHGLFFWVVISAVLLILSHLLDGGWLIFTQVFVLLIDKSAVHDPRFG